MAGSVLIRLHNGCPGQRLKSVNFGIHRLVNIFSPHTVFCTVTRQRFCLLFYRTSAFEHVPLGAVKGDIPTLSGSSCQGCLSYLKII